MGRREAGLELEADKETEGRFDRDDAGRSSGAVIVNVRSRKKFEETRYGEGMEEEKEEERDRDAGGDGPCCHVVVDVCVPILRELYVRARQH